MGKIKYYDNGMVNKTFRFPDDVAEWIESTENASQIIRDIIDEKFQISQERSIPEYKKPRRPHRGRPRKDEDPNYVPPEKRPRGRPPKSKEEKVLKETKDEIG